MRLIKNYHDLATTPERKVLLDVIDSGLAAIQPQNVIRKKVHLHGNILTIGQHQYDLRKFENIYLVGFGKGSAGISQQVTDILADKLTKGYVIDTTSARFPRKIHFTLGTHPLPSKQNMEFTQKVLHDLRDLSQNDLVLVIICGGGSAMLVSPIEGVSLDEKIAVNKELLTSGADIIEMNTVRKRLSAVKGGKLAKAFYPARIVSLIFSDVPGNDLAFIASGPTVKDPTSIADAKKIIGKYHLAARLAPILSKMSETPKDAKYFAKVDNILLLSNLTALQAMKETARKHGYTARIVSDTFQGDSSEVGKDLISKTHPGEILLVGGETTLKIHGKGRGGRNQEVVLNALSEVENSKTIIASIASDGWDNTEHAGALADHKTIDTTQRKKLDTASFLDNNDSYTYFEKVGDGIVTGRLPSNVSDLIVVLKK